MPFLPLQNAPSGGAWFGRSNTWFGSNSVPVTTYPMTMSCWFWPSRALNPYDPTNAGGGALMALNDSTAAYSAQHYIMSVGYVSTGSNVKNVTITAATTTLAGVTSSRLAGYRLNAWNLAVGVFTSSSSRTMYLNGNYLNGTSTTVKAPNVPDRFTIGATRGTTTAAYWGGGISDAAIWNVALGTGEIGQLYGGACPLTIQRSALAGYWPLGNKSGIPINYDMLGITHLTINNGSGPVPFEGLSSLQII